jgi:alpha-amylase/alpha-mannosidase (GH57 family)
LSVPVAVARAAKDKLPVVLCWHMHQPQYRDLLTGDFVLPWVYLHGIKDYTDMAHHLELVPLARAVVNFSPVLLEQLESYALAIDAHLRHGASLPDAVLSGLTPAALSLERAPALELLRACLKANQVNLIERFPAYRQLSEEAREVLAGAAHSAVLLADISVWFHLAWLGESVRRTDPKAMALIDKGRGFSAADRRDLLELIGTVLASIVPRYRRMFESGQVELSISPWGHPILPLLFDFRTALEQMPRATLPEHAGYPGGARRARWHLEHAVEAYTRAFGSRPRGCWPSEGAVSADTVALLGEFGFDWLATSEGVLRASLAAHPGATEIEPLNRPWRLGGRGPVCFFRDDELSDRVGFAYATWHGDDAAADFVNYLEQLAVRYEHDPGRVVAVILDGENAWEHYPYNGYYFLSAMYRTLADHATLRLTTFRELDLSSGAVAALPQLVAGSWVHASLGTWIGTPDKNLAWDLLCSAKRCVDEVLGSGRLGAAERRAVEEQLGVCEGSDWAWWFADFNPAAAVADFDALYRRHLRNLYQLLGQVAPPSLATPFAHGTGGAEHGGTMQRARQD